MRLDPSRFIGRVHQRDVALCVLRNDHIELAVCNHGARILQLLVPDRAGVVRDVVLGHDSLAQLLAGMPSMGAFIGRYANRLAGAGFVIDGTRHPVPANDGPHCLHGGPAGSRHQVFDVLAHQAQRLCLGWTFRSSEDGFPGDVDLEVSYRLEGSAVVIDYRATVREAATPLSFTCHPFFNLEGEQSASALDHALQIEADRFVPVGADRIPLGRLEPVTGTAFDFRAPRTVREALAQDHPQLRLGPVPGFDHTLVTSLSDGLAPSTVRRQARLAAPHSGIVMEVWSDAPALQLYTCAPMDGSLPRHAGKHGRIHGRDAAVCLEPQRLPDAPNQPAFGPCVVMPGQTLPGRIEYRFGVQDRVGAAR